MRAHRLQTAERNEDADHKSPVNGWLILYICYHENTSHPTSEKKLIHWAACTVHTSVVMQTLHTSNCIAWYWKQAFRLHAKEPFWSDVRDTFNIDTASRTIHGSAIAISGRATRSLRYIDWSCGKRLNWDFESSVVLFEILTWPHIIHLLTMWVKIYNYTPLIHKLLLPRSECRDIMLK